MKTLISALILAAGTSAMADAPNRVVMAVDRINEVRNLPAILAESLGYFKEEGLLVTLMDGRDEVPTEQQLADGRVDASMAFYHHTIMSQVGGHATVSVIDLGISPALTVMVAARLKDQVRSVADLRGRKIFTGGANSGKTTTANWLMAHAGLSNNDFTRLPLQDRDKMAAALASGEADAIVAHEPDASYYARTGAAVEIADITTPEGTKKNLGSLFPTTSVYMTEDYVRSHPDQVQHLVNALVKTLKYIASHKAAEIWAALPKEIGGKDPKTYQEDLARDLPMFFTNGLMPEADARMEFKVFTEFQPKYAATKFEPTYTNRFVDAALKKAD
jgi:NitT/TauT family transport system substrate-binding protein